MRPGRTLPEQHKTPRGGEGPAPRPEKSTRAPVIPPPSSKLPLLSSYGIVPQSLSTLLHSGFHSPTSGTPTPCAHNHACPLAEPPHSSLPDGQGPHLAADHLNLCLLLLTPKHTSRKLPHKSHPTANHLALLKRVKQASLFMYFFP